GGLVGVVSAVIAGLLIPRLGRKRALVAFGIGTVAAIAAVIPLVAAGGALWAIVAVVLVNAFTSASYVVLYTINMDYCRPSNAGSDFTIQASISYFVRLVAAGLI